MERGETEKKVLTINKFKNKLNQKRKGVTKL